MPGIYLHIPFCRSKCAYCGFYSVPSLKRKGEFLAELEKEIYERKDYLHGSPVDTVYFGGGTPSLLTIEELKTIKGWLHHTYLINKDAEVTLEANPDTLSPDYLMAVRKLGVNRLSIGIQSFFDNDLKYLSRRHDSQHALQCVGWAKAAGFENISLDLIYGLPTSDANQWTRNLDLFIEMEVPHLSAYALTLEPNAILTKQIEKGMVPPVNEEDAVRDYGILCQKMKQEGFQHYEISNFCKPGMHSRHNSSYWLGVPYLGLGPSAHSYDGVSRQWDDEKEVLSPEQVYDEYVMLRLRTSWGVDLEHIKQVMGQRFADHCQKQAEPLVAQGRLSLKDNILSLSDEQMLFADGIAEELFW